MISFKQSGSDQNTYKLTAQITSYGAWCLRQLFNIRAKNALHTKLFKSNRDALNTLSISFNWFSVTESCHHKLNVMDIHIPKDEMEYTLDFLNSENLEKYLNSIEPLTLDFKRFILQFRDALLEIHPTYGCKLSTFCERIKGDCTYQM